MLIALLASRIRCSLWRRYARRWPFQADLTTRLPEARIVADYGGSLALLAYLPGHSTSILIDRIVARYGPAADAPRGTHATDADTTR